MNRFWGMFAVMLALVVSAPSSAAEPKYTLLRLNLSYGGVTGISPYGSDSLNDLGQVAGSYQPSEGQYQAALTRPNQPFNPATDILTPLVLNHGGTAYGVNDLGQVVGAYSPTADFNPRAFRTQPNAPVNFATDHLMSGLNPRHTGWAAAINNLGQTVGSNGLFAFRTSPNGEPLQIVDLGGLFGRGAGANNINDLGQVTGGSAGLAYRTGPNQTIQDSDALEPLGPTGRNEGTDINNQGVVVGGAELTPLGDVHAFRAIPGRPMEDLGTLNGSRKSSAFSINEAGWIVGASNVVPSSVDYFNAVLWHHGQIINLDELVADTGDFFWIETALDINNKGQILVNYIDGRGPVTEVGLGILNPIIVPEPSVLAMLLVAGPFWGMARRRVRKDPDQC